MRGTRPRRDDGRIDYTKLAKGQGRVRLHDEETREETDEGAAYESGVDSVGGDSLLSGNTDDSSLQVRDTDEIKVITFKIKRNITKFPPCH